MGDALRQRLAGRTSEELIGLIGKNIAHVICSISPAAARALRRNAQFDRLWGTETSGLVNLSGLAINPARARHGVRYQASNGEALKEAVSRFDIDPAEWSLVDYGSGKGRIIMLAAAMGSAVRSAWNFLRSYVLSQTIMSAAS